MKKLLGILVLSLTFYINPIMIKDSNAGLFSSPLEKCMDRVIKGSFNGNEQHAAAAAKICQGADESTDRCMDRVIKGSFRENEQYAAAAAKLCLGN